MNDDLLICRCEEIAREEIEIAIRENDLRTMQEVKRVTRAGMGLCQGKTCGRLIMTILARETQQPRSEIAPDTSRPPVHPVPVICFVNMLRDEEQASG